MMAWMNLLLLALALTCSEAVNNGLFLCMVHAKALAVAICLSLAAGVGEYILWAGEGVLQAFAVCAWIRAPAAPCVAVERRFLPLLNACVGLL